MSIADTIAHLAASDDEALFLRQVVEKSDRCQRQNTPQWTRFLTPREQDLAHSLLSAFSGAEHVYLGGVDSAERKLLYFLPEWMESVPEEDSPICFLRCSYAAQYGSVAHRDLLGALMGLGIARDCIGDLFLSDGQADAAVLREISGYVQTNLESAGRVRLTVREIPASEVIVPAAQVREIRDTVASLRLDGIVSAGFGMAREKAAALIRSGKVQLEHLECTKPDQTVAQGMTVTARGFGKLTVSEVGGLSKKGRVGIVLWRYI